MGEDIGGGHISLQISRKYANGPTRQLPCKQGAADLSASRSPPGLDSFGNMFFICLMTLWPQFHDFGRFGVCFGVQIGREEEW